MKKLNVQIGTLTIALLLALASTSVTAASKYGDRHERAGKQQHAAKYSSASRYSRNGRGHRAGRGSRHYTQPHHGYGSRHGYRSHHGYRSQYGYYGRGYRRGYHNSWTIGSHYPSYFGAAVLGAALSHSWYHMHAGAVCYDRHNDNYWDDRRDQGYSEVVGCHRVEQSPDGTQRRLDVPLSQCN